MTIDLLTQDEVAQLRDLVSTSTHIVNICHTNADGDALGSVLSWAEYLRQQGKQVTVIVPDMYPDFLQWLPGTQDIIRFDKKRELATQLLQEADLVCCMDLNTLSRSSEEIERVLLEAHTPLLLIDHHPLTNVNANPNCELRTVHCELCTANWKLSLSYPTMSSTAEVAFRLIWQLGGYESMTRNMAVNIYCGMMTDTGGFTFNSSRPEIFFIISQLIAKGIDKDRIYRNIYHVFSVDRLRLTGYILYQKMKVLTPLRASYYTISREEQKRFHFIKGDAEGLVNLPLQIKGHRLSISMREDTEKDNLIWISLRSVDDFPCNKMAEEFFNGGGHKNASGGKLYCSLDEAEKTARQAIQAYAKML
ncbi:MAG: DHH family phosphoesterase [Prevotella sp.]|nr:DHH family phosphoesterase [Prevotella sp.]